MSRPCHKRENSQKVKIVSKCRTGESAVHDGAGLGNETPPKKA